MNEHSIEYNKQLYLQWLSERMIMLNQVTPTVAKEYDAWLSRMGYSTRVIETRLFAASLMHPANPFSDLVR